MMPAHSLGNPESYGRKMWHAGYGRPDPRTAEEMCRAFEGDDPNNRVSASVEALPGGRRLLDIGCGSGHALWSCRRNYRQLHGIDLLPGYLTVVQRWAAHSQTPVRLVAADLGLGRLPYASNVFDAVTLIAFLEFVEMPGEILAEAARVLVPGGTAVLQVGNAASYRNRVRLLCGRELWTANYPALNGGVLHFFTLDALARLAESAGLEVVSTACSGRWRRLRTRWPSLLGNDLIVVARKGAA